MVAWKRSRSPYLALNGGRIEEPAGLRQQVSARTTSANRCNIPDTHFILFGRATRSSATPPMATPAARGAAAHLYNYMRNYMLFNIPLLHSVSDTAHLHAPRACLMQHMFQVLERGLKAIPLSVDLWIHYLNHVKATRTEDHAFIRSQYERAIGMAINYLFSPSVCFIVNFFFFYNVIFLF